MPKEMMKKDLLNKGAMLIAPHIIRNDLAKKFMFLQMFADPNESIYNILCIGSAASGKTQLGLDINKLHPKSTYVGKKTTEAGLFGYSSRQGIVGGSLRQAKNGLFIIDETDKIDKSVLNSLLEVMETGKSTMAKWGQVNILKVFANFLMLANPRNGKWLGQPNISEIPFDPPFLSRFHAIIPFMDIPSREYEKLSKSFYIKENMRENDIRRIEQVREFITVANGINDVKIEYDIIDRITKFTGILKEKYESFAPTVTPRQIEGILSCVKAHARLNLRDHCKQEDFDVVSQIYQELFDVWMEGLME